ncbi:MAG: RHS repeat-associated core domain-containing protein, partial [Aureliella sp.]
YEWDFRNRLTAVIDRITSGGAIVKQVNYEYDAYNRLVKRSLDADGAGPNPATTQYWAYDEGINAVLQFDGAAASNQSHRYLWAEQVDQLLADEQITSPLVAGNTLWGLADNLGTLRDIADFNESTSVTTVTNHRTFNANGKLVAETNAAVDLLFAFTGKQLDDSTGLQHNLYRWYDGNLGQWLSEDPMGFEAGDENLRRYVGNTVTFTTDPLGLWDMGIGTGTTIGSAIGGVIGGIGGAIVGGVGGTFVLPGVGTITVASGGAIVGAGLGVYVGVIIGGLIGTMGELIGNGTELVIRDFADGIGGAIDAIGYISRDIARENALRQPIKSVGPDDLPDPTIAKAKEIQEIIDRLRAMLGESTTAPQRNDIAVTVDYWEKQLRALFK